MTDNRTTELLQELSDLACDIHAAEIIDHVHITHIGWTFDSRWLDSWHVEFDRITGKLEQAIAATLGGEYKRGYEDGLHANTKAAFAAAKQAIAVTLDGKMTYNRTTELLRKLLEERGVNCQTHYLHTSWCVGSKLYVATDILDGTLTVTNLTPEQAIAATLGEEKAGRKSPPEGGPGPCGQPSDDIIHEAATLGSDAKGCESLLWELVGALDVADATDASKKPIVAEYARRIAATLGSGSNAEWYFAFSCGCELYWDEPEPPNYCPNCGAKVVGDA